ncbi:hypothetical protein [Qipengyuania nanhaisediminis]|uniref:hypothetical protein n=1 Tax=Qipengyuania nanhaisediminis TaxID=604088 RepID=UPI0038B2FAAD
MSAFKLLSVTFLIAVVSNYSAPISAQDFIEPETCELSIASDSAIDWRGLYGRGYEVFEPSEDFEVIMVEVRHIGPPCEFFITATDLGGSVRPSLNGSGGQLAYDLRRQPSGPSIFSPDFIGDQFSRLAGRFGPGPNSTTVELYLTIPSGQAIGGGAYNGQPILRLFRDDPTGPDLMDEVVVDVTVPVPSVLSVEIAEAAPGLRSMDVDLGNLGRDVNKTVVFEVRSNAAITASVSSQNNGMLAHFAGGPSIPYTLSLGDNQMNLQNSAQTIRLRDTGSLLQPVTLDITVNGNPGAAAGQYNDSLMITFIAD